jgi:RimJ/RimL family protein N-acetyltransferase
MLKRQLESINRQQREIATKQKEQTTAIQQQNMIMMQSNKPHKRDWIAEIEALEDDEIIQFICEEKPPSSVVTKALKAFAASLDSEIYGD